MGGPLARQLHAACVDSPRARHPMSVGICEALPMSSAAPPTLRLSKAYLALAVILFGIEVFIALAVHDAFVRPILGDVLVVALIYAAVRSVLEVPTLPTAAGVFLFACAVECAQYAHLVDRLGLRDNAVARVVIGTSYDPRDFLAYAVGAVAVVAVERVYDGRRRRRVGSSSERDAA